MRYVISLRSSLKFLRSLTDPAQIAVFSTYEDAEGVASVLGVDAEILVWS
jgi:hypothetical protein